MTPPAAPAPDEVDLDPLAASDDADHAMSPYLRRIALVAGLGSLLFGYDTGVVSSALIAIGDDLAGQKLTTFQEELVVTATTLGALVGALAAGWLSDRFGRKKVLLGSSVLFTLGAVEQAAAQIPKELILGRGIVGLGVGLASSVSPVYLAEICPANLRGRLVTLLVVLITFGQVLSYIVGAVFFNVSHGWRWMFLSAVVPSLAQLALTLSIPESPRYLIKRGNTTDARLALARVYSKLSAPDLEQVVARIERTLQLEAETVVRLSSFGTVVDALWRDLPTRRALIVACGLQFFQQATGFNSLMYYSGKILLSAGFAHPPLFAIFIAFSNWMCTIISLRYIDKLRTILGMIAGLSAMSFCFLFIKIRPAEPADDEPPAAATAWSILALASMVLFCCFYALGLGNVPWVIQSELFSYNVRSVAGGLSTATNWLANLIVAATFLHLVQLITTSGAFALYAVLAIAAWFFVYLRVKETAGLSIEECRKLFEDGPSKYADYQAVSLPHETDGFGGQEDADRDTGLK